MNTFEIGEKALCYHGPLIYEAKVLKIENWDETSTKTSALGIHYFVHYKGWKQTWDEWVPQSRVLKYIDANIALQKSLLNDAKASAGGSSKATASGSHAAGGNKAGGAAGRRDARGEGGSRLGKRRNAEGDDSGMKKPELKLTIPDTLKVILVDDWEAVTKNSRLVSLPREPTVQQILEEFRAHIQATPEAFPQVTAVLPTLISGLQTYFDRSLGAALLYRFERAQYADVRKQYITGQHVESGKEKDMSAIYGAEHLARLIVNLPAMVKETTMDTESVNLLGLYVTELMRWMMTQKDRIFLKEYDYPGSLYQNLART